MKDEQLRRSLIILCVISIYFFIDGLIDFIEILNFNDVNTKVYDTICNTYGSDTNVMTSDEFKAYEEYYDYYHGWTKVKIFVTGLITTIPLVLLIPIGKMYFMNLREKRENL